jgi:hypothetical protein
VVGGNGVGFTPRKRRGKVAAAAAAAAGGKGGDGAGSDDDAEEEEEEEEEKEKEDAEETLNHPAPDDRVARLAQFQTKALSHALKFPSCERVSYSTCSVHALENELVVKEVLPEALKLGYTLEIAVPTWHRRGLHGAGDLAPDSTKALLRADQFEVGAVHVECNQRCSLKAPGFKPLILKCDIVVSTFAFTFNSCAATSRMTWRDSSWRFSPGRRRRGRSGRPRLRRLRRRRRRMTRSTPSRWGPRRALTPPDPQLKGAWYPGGFKVSTLASIM